MGNRNELLREVQRLLPRPARRLFLRNALSLGGLALLTGCNVVDESKAETVLKHVSLFNDRVQAWLFDPARLAPTYSESRITRPFPFNAFYPPSKAPVIDPDTYRLEVSGLVADAHSWS